MKNYSESRLLEIFGGKTSERYWEGNCVSHITPFYFNQYLIMTSGCSQVFTTSFYLQKWLAVTHYSSIYKDVWPNTPSSIQIWIGQLLRIYARESVSKSDDLAFCFIHLIKRTIRLQLWVLKWCKGLLDAVDLRFSGSALRLTFTISFRIPLDK